MAAMAEVRRLAWLVRQRDLLRQALLEVQGSPALAIKLETVKFDVADEIEAERALFGAVRTLLIGHCTVALDHIDLAIAQHRLIHPTEEAHGETQEQAGLCQHVAGEAPRDRIEGREERPTGEAELQPGLAARG